MKKAITASVLGIFAAVTILGGCANPDFEQDTSPISQAEEVTPTPTATVTPTASPAKINPLEDQFSSTNSGSENIQSTGMTGITNSGVNVRETPRGTTIDALPNRAEVEILAQDGGWYLVYYEEEGIQGYIYGQFLDINGVNALELDEDLFD